LPLRAGRALPRRRGASPLRRAVQHPHRASMRRGMWWLMPLVTLAGGCDRTREAGPPLVERLSPRGRGVTFANMITPTDSLNALTDSYIYNGAGVGVGDIDNDGLPDLFFAGNMVSSRLYRNTGDLRFADITQSAGVTTQCWATGVSLVDINQ